MTTWSPDWNFISSFHTASSVKLFSPELWLLLHALLPLASHTLLPGFWRCDSLPSLSSSLCGPQFCSPVILLLPLLPIALPISSGSLTLHSWCLNPNIGSKPWDSNVRALGSLMSWGSKKQKTAGFAGAVWSQDRKNSLFFWGENQMGN